MLTGRPRRVGSGIRQFIDIGSGIPGRGNVHELVHAADPQATVVYVEHDPVAVAHWRAHTHAIPSVTVVHADARRPAEVLEDSEVSALIDFHRPVGLLLISVLHLVADDESPEGLLNALRDALAPG